ncbi:MAG TPA: DinB family protein [Methylomirabilota bacterium]|nr:DinB family protein [Methylomirabilota bacterium]
MTPEEQVRIRGYLTSQAARLAPEQIIGKVQEAMGQLDAAARAVPAARFTDSPAPQEWSANEVMAHVVEAGRHFGGAITRVLDGLPPGAPRDAPARDTTPRPLAEWWADLGRDRDALFARVRSAPPMARLEATIPHPFFGALNWRETLLFMRLHDLDHAGQLQKIAAALGGTPGV